MKLRLTHKERLLAAARLAMQRAYAPYSGFRVGAALLCTDGSIFAGCNIENASYPVGLCAERAALAAAVSAGKREFAAILIVSDAEQPCPPCGMCRQALVEFAPELIVVLVTRDGAENAYKLHDLIPNAFVANYLQAEKEKTGC